MASLSYQDSFAQNAFSVCRASNVQGFSRMSRPGFSKKLTDGRHVEFQLPKP